jgi:hypothetical protein
LDELTSSEAAVSMTIDALAEQVRDAPGRPGEDEE